MVNYRAISYAIFRITVGMMFLFYGIGKFRAGISNSADSIIKAFEGKLPLILVSPFAHVLPFLEVTVGVLVLFGIFTEVSLIFAGLLMMALTFGVVVSGQAGIVANNVGYAFIVFVLAYLVDNNRYSIDGLVRRK